MKSFIILFSGAGTTMDAILKHIPEESGECAAVITNQKNAKGIKVAEKYNTRCIVLSERNRIFEDISDTINNLNPDLIVLAGFMLVFPPETVRNYYGKIINIHPSLLPKHKGLNTYSKALTAKDESHGSTVHFVDDNVDSGPIIAQVEVSISDSETVETLKEKTKAQERWFYPKVINWVLQERVTLHNRDVFLDGDKLPERGVRYPSR